MERDQSNILKNFMNENEDLVESPIKEELVQIRNTYTEEIKAPGCTPCMKNGLRHKYQNVIQNLMSEKAEKLIKEASEAKEVLEVKEQSVPPETETEDPFHPK